MKYVEITANGITNDEKAKFFKLYVQLSKKAKKFVGRKKDSQEIQENWKTMLDSMEKLAKL